MNFIYTQSGSFIEYGVILLLMLLIISIPMVALKLINIVLIDKAASTQKLTGFDRYLLELSTDLVHTHLKFAQWAASFGVALVIVGALGRAFILITKK